MKVSIFITNLEGSHFEISNTAKSVIDIGNSNVSKMYGFLECTRCNDYDLIQYDVTPKAFIETTLKIIHKGNSEAETRFILEYIRNKIREKSDLMHEIQVLKKIKSKKIQYLINELKENIHKNYFEYRIEDILKEYRNS